MLTLEDVKRALEVARINGSQVRVTWPGDRRFTEQEQVRVGTVARVSTNLAELETRDGVALVSMGSVTSVEDA